MDLLFALLASTYFLLAPNTAVATYSGPPAILFDIAQCESGMKQYTATGRIVESYTHDIGLFQINLSHLKEARALGWDIYTSEGNTAYAVYLYNKYGTSPWNASKHCWSKLAADDV